VNVTASTVLRGLDETIEELAEISRVLKSALADTEPAPVSIVLIRDRSSGRIHRRARIEGITGLMAYEADNADQAGVFDVIPDLSTVSDDLDLCGRCFGGVDIPAEVT
jgi:hypothetical protein